MIDNASPAVHPYANVIFDALWRQLDVRHPDEAISCLATLGSLFSAFGTGLRDHGAELMRQAVDTLKDQASITKKRLLVRVLADVASGTGVVVDPYYSFPTLMKLLLGILLDRYFSFE